VSKTTAGSEQVLIGLQQMRACRSPGLPCPRSLPMLLQCPMEQKRYARIASLGRPELTSIGSIYGCRFGRNKLPSLLHRPPWKLYILLDGAKDAGTPGEDEGRDIEGALLLSRSTDSEILGDTSRAALYHSQEEETGWHAYR